MKLKIIRFLIELCWKFVIMYTCILGAAIIATIVQVLFFGQPEPDEIPHIGLIIFATIITIPVIWYWRRRWGIRV